MLKSIDWNQLRGRSFKTINGASFQVTEVTRKNVIIRPEHGRRDYDLAISAELERGLDALWAGDFFPSPTELLRIGVRHERNSYVWGILHAVWSEQLSDHSHTLSPDDFAGDWQVSELADMDESYLEESDEPPLIRIDKPEHGSFYGTYHFGLSSGSLDGALRVFGGNQILIFGYEGKDEMDEVYGGGWARINSRGELEGEFMSRIGRFTAERVRTKFVRAKKSR